MWTRSALRWLSHSRYVLHVPANLDIVFQKRITCDCGLEARYVGYHSPKKSSTCDCGMEVPYVGYRILKMLHICGLEVRYIGYRIPKKNYMCLRTWSVLIWYRFLKCITCDLKCVTLDIAFQKTICLRSYSVLRWVSHSKDLLLVTADLKCVERGEKWRKRKRKEEEGEEEGKSMPLVTQYPFYFGNNSYIL